MAYEILYKLTNKDGKTRPEYANECQWGPGVMHRAKVTAEPTTCGPTVVHAFRDFWNGVVNNPGQYSNPRLWVAAGEVVAVDDNSQFKVGCLELTTLKEITHPAKLPDTHFAMVALDKRMRNYAWYKRKRTAGNSVWQAFLSTYTLTSKSRRRKLRTFLTTFPPYTS